MDAVGVPGRTGRDGMGALRQVQAPDRRGWLIVERDDDDDRALVARFTGELDGPAADLYAAHLRAVIALGPPALAVDLREVTFLCSTGIRLLVMLREWAVRKGVGWQVSGASTVVDKVLKIAGLEDVRSPVPGPGSRPPH